MSGPRRGLKFCPETNDLLYPRSNNETKRLEYYCKNCQHVEQAQLQDYCVYASETTEYSAKDKTVVMQTTEYSAKDKTVVMQDVISDPTLPRTKDVRCPKCNHNEAVFVSEATESGMTLHNWRDYV
eukprot:gene31105-6236_t